MDAQQRQRLHAGGRQEEAQRVRAVRHVRQRGGMVQRFLHGESRRREGSARPEERRETRPARRLVAGTPEERLQLRPQGGRSRDGGHLPGLRDLRIPLREK